MCYVSPFLRFFLLLCLATGAIVFTTPTIFGQTKDDFQGAKLVSVPKLELPDKAKEDGLGGKVIVQVIIDEKGKVTGSNEIIGPDWICSSVRTAGIDALRKAANEAALKASFIPATKDGKGVKSLSQLTFDFPVPPKVEKPEGPRISGGVRNGKLIHVEKPVYPKEAKAAGIAGTVSVKLLIFEDGSIYSAEPMDGPPSLRSPARIAACGSKYSPTLLAGNPVKVAGIITYNFTP
jgi:hypothetical protein